MRQVMVYASQKIYACFSPLIAKAMTILRGIHFVADTGLLPAVMESDAKSVVELINTKCCSCADVGVIISDILALINFFNISVSFVPRKANMTAHALTKLALVFDRDLFWMEEHPPCLESVILLFWRIFLLSFSLFKK
ncbi:hypothetical protein LWI29_003361 [Acer saccharum]|uniref:RNase H type-1 domain-containing protein n=1 Tax=Acer saccharum TaxID=4024 RepID=A0AA39S3H2_ACESA|nr:hypothetical protein LWI29_003361 [Acer saccharum]